MKVEYKLQIKAAMTNPAESFTTTPKPAHLCSKIKHHRS